MEEGVEDAVALLRVPAGLARPGLVAEEDGLALLQEDEGAHAVARPGGGGGRGRGGGKEERRVTAALILLLNDALPTGLLNLQA